MADVVVADEGAFRISHRASLSDFSPLSSTCNAISAPCDWLRSD